jgi:arylsulfatase A-like enzyme
MHKTARFGNEALEFISGCKPDQPFCLSLSFNAVHARDKEAREYPPDDRDAQLYDDKQMPVPPLATDEAWRRLPSDMQECEGRVRWKLRFDTPEKTQAILRDYYRLITGVDREVGRIVEALENAKLADNTVIVFTSDNGYALGDRGMADKWFMYEEDIRVPLVVVDPRLSSSLRGRTVDAMTLNVDIPPTLLELAGVSVPSSMQGRSLMPMIEDNRTPKDWRTDFFYEHHFSGAVSIPSTEGVRTEQFAYLRWIDANPVGEELYDLRSDPLEEKNLVNDPAYASTLDSLRKRWAVLKEQAK